MGEEVKTGRYPCLVEGLFVRPCTSLSRALDKSSSGHGRSKGLFLEYVMDLKTGENTMSFVRIKLGEFLKNGVVINVCPFCGINISEHIKRASS